MKAVAVAAAVVIVVVVVVIVAVVVAVVVDRSTNTVEAGAGWTGCLPNRLRLRHWRLTVLCRPCSRCGRTSSLPTSVNPSAVESWN